MTYAKIGDDCRIMKIGHNVDDLCSMDAVIILTRNHTKTLRVSFSLPQGVEVFYLTNDCTITVIRHNVDDLCNIETVKISTGNHTKTLRVLFHSLFIS